MSGGRGPIPSASIAENLRLNALVFVPNALQGIFRRRPKPVAVATRAGTDGRALGLLESMRRSYDGGPVWVRVVRTPALLLFDTADVRRVLEASPDPFAADPEAKRKGMSAFQPDALTISRGEEWRARRAFAEDVLDTGRSEHRLADPFRLAVTEEIAHLLGRVTANGEELFWDDFHWSVRRIARRVILGKAAVDDEDLTDLLAELMEEGNGMPDEPSGRHRELEERIRSYLETGQEGSLVSLAAAAPHNSGINLPGQLVHWLFAMGDTLAANAFRALALLATHPAHRGRFAAEPSGGYREACLSEAMRLWPTTPLLSRVAIQDVAVASHRVPAGSQILISNLANHRDRAHVPFADRFAPEEWVTGGAAEDWAFNHFSHGPQGCPGAALALDLGAAILGDLLAAGEWTCSAELDPDEPLPHMLDYFALSFTR